MMIGRADSQTTQHFFNLSFCGIAILFRNDDFQMCQSISAFFIITILSKQLLFFTERIPETWISLEHDITDFDVFITEMILFKQPRA